MGPGSRPPLLVSVQLIEPRRAGSGCPCLRLWPSRCWVGSSWWAAKGRGSGGLQQWKATGRGSSSGCPGGSGRTAQHPGSPASLVVAASSCLCLCHLHGCLLRVSPSTLTSSYKDTHHCIEVPPSSSLIWRDRVVSVKYLGVPSWGVGDNVFKVAAGGGTLPFFPLGVKRTGCCPAGQAAGGKMVMAGGVLNRAALASQQRTPAPTPMAQFCQRATGPVDRGPHQCFCSWKDQRFVPVVMEACPPGVLQELSWHHYLRAWESESRPVASVPRPTLSLGGEREAHGQAPAGHTWEPLVGGPAGQ